MKRKDAFPSVFMSKEDLGWPDHPKKVRAIIEDVVVEKIQGDNGTEEKAVMLFTDPDLKKLILNMINWTTLEVDYGEDSEDWAGKPVEIVVDPTVMFGKKRVGGVRVHVPEANSNASKASADTWTWDEAQNQAESVGISKSDLVAKLKAAGKVGWNAARDTGFVRDLVEAALAQDAPADDPDDIPF